MSLHSLFIILHTIAGIVAFVTGWVSLIQLRKTPAPTIVWIYLVSLISLVIFMLGAILVDWSGIQTTQRFMYSGLLLLGIYMLVRAIQAYLVQKKHEQAWRPSYVDHVGFTLISLFDGFVIVSAIDLGLPGWGVAVIAVLGVVAGIYSMNRTKSTIASN